MSPVKGNDSIPQNKKGNNDEERDVDMIKKVRLVMLKSVARKKKKKQKERQMMFWFQMGHEPRPQSRFCL